MEYSNKVFIATSLDGYIADKNGNIDWLNAIPNPNQIDMGYGAFVAQIDALIMGRVTFETVCGFDMDWPYKKPVFVLSNSLTTIPEKFDGKVVLVNGNLNEILNEVNHKGYHKLYIDGGSTIQSFLRADLIDEMIITIIPILLGGGIPLFSELPNQLNFECVESNIFLDKVVQNRFVRRK